MKKKWLIGIIAYVGLLAICLIVVYLFPQVRGILTTTYIAEQGEISLSEDVTGYVLRDETVYTAASASDIKRIAKEGTLYPANTQVLEIAPGETASTENENQYKAVLSLLGDDVKPTADGMVGSAGYISYSVDGYEARLNPKNIKDIKKSEYDAINVSLKTDTVKGQCTIGDPLFKMTKNGKWYLVFFVDIDNTFRYEEGDTVDITIGDVTEQAYISEVTEGVHVSRIVLKCGFFYKDCLKDRKVNATVTTASAKGLKLETKSVVERDGNKGVLVKDKLGNYTFTRVALKADNGKECIAYQDLFMDDEGNFVETIGIYDEIVTRPTEKEIKEAA